jgi:tetratricopeptide (TPR) repeat protein
MIKKTFLAKKIYKLSQKRALSLSFILLFAISVIIPAFIKTAHAKDLYKQNDYFEQSPIFYLSIFPKEIKDQETYYFNRLLEYFTMKEFELSIEKLVMLLDTYPESKFKEYTVFLKADNEFYMALRDKENYLLPVVHSYQAAIDAYPDSRYAPWAYFQIGNSYNRMNYSYEAIAKYAEFMEKYPDSVHFESASVYKAERDYDAAKYDEVIATLKGFTERYPESKFNPLVNFLLGDSYLQADNKKTAFDYFEKVKGVEKLDPDKTLYYSKILMKNKKYQEAIYYLTAIINYFPKFSNIKDVYVLLADSFLKLKDYNNAVYNYFYVIKKYPKSKQAVQSRLRIAEQGSLIDKKKYNLVMKSTDVDFVLDLKKVYIDVYKTNKKNKYGEKALFELGKIAEDQRNDLRAMNIFKKVYEEFSDGEHNKESFKLFTKHFNKLVKQYYLENEIKKVVALYHKYKKEIKTASGKDITGVLFYIGKSLIDLRLYSLATEVFDRIRNEDVTYENEEVIYLCMIAAYRSRNYEKAEECSSELLVRYKKSKYKNEAEYLRAKSAYFLKRYEEAVSLIEAYIKKKANRKNEASVLEAYTDIAEAYNKMGREKDAISYYKKILNMVDKKKKEKKYKKIKEDTILKLAGHSYMSKNYENAITYYEEYFKDRTLVPDDNVHLFYLAKSYVNDFDYDTALLYFNKLLENSNRGFYAKSAKEEIKFIKFLALYEDYLL